MPVLMSNASRHLIQRRPYMIIMKYNAVIPNGTQTESAYPLTFLCTCVNSARSSPTNTLHIHICMMCWFSFGHNPHLNIPIDFLSKNAIAVVVHVLCFSVFVVFY